MSAPVVAIDGPSGVGKSTVAARLAARLDVPHVDTGAFYRAATLAVLRAGIDPEDAAAAAEVVDSADLEQRGGRTFLDGEDVGDEVRGRAATSAVSAVAAHPEVRAALVEAQRRAVRPAGGVVEGRDIGTVVLPDADVKVYLTADPRERARRRALQEGGDPDEVERQLADRDRRDRERSAAPLAKADDAFEIDTTDLAIEDVIDRIVALLPNGRDLPRAVSARRELPRVAVVGRPNVGKSTLVNRVLGKRAAIVEERPGVTRDRAEYLVSWRGRPFLLVDTGGWEHAPAGMNARVVEQAERAIAAADAVLFVVDTTVGALGDDERYALSLRKADVPVLLVANKVDSPYQEPDIHDLYVLGLGEPHPVSALHGRGVGDLLDELVAHLPEPISTLPDDVWVPHIAIVGRPNVGKSSLFNRLAGEDRSIVDAVPHTTRDAIDTHVAIEGEPWVFVDTAGLRRRYRHGEDTELYSVDRTRWAVDAADLALFVVDASASLAEQDQRLAAMVRDAGCGIVLVVNKWDLVDETRRGYLEREIDRLLGFTAWAPRVNVSALTGRGIARVMPWLRRVRDAYATRIPTGELNAWLEEVTTRVPPPSGRGRRKRVRVKYITQVDVRPPTFVVFMNGPLQPAYERYLQRELRQQWDFVGTPLVVKDAR